jgi:uncharacterized protein
MDQQDAHAVGLAVDATQAKLARILTSKAQELILLPTEKCNFRCTYCYEDFKIGKMSAGVQSAVEQFIDRRIATLDRLLLSWFGGEPLLAQEVVRRISRFAHERSRIHGTNLAGSLTTNAYLLDYDLFEELVSYRQDFYQITLDGFGDVHDEVRRLANGKGTFDRIWSNLLAMRASGQTFEILLRVHVRRENIEALEGLMKEIALAFGDDPRFRFGFEHVRDLGGAGGRTVKRPVQFKELVAIEAGLRRAYDLALGRDVPSAPQEQIAQQLAVSLTAESAGSQRAEDLAAGGGYICYASKPNSLLVRADGRVGKCTVALYDDRNTIGRLTEDGSVEIDQDKLRPWIRGIADLDADALACPLKDLPRQAAQTRPAVVAAQ